jgi:hypothetical protein
MWRRGGWFKEGIFTGWVCKDGLSARAGTDSQVTAVVAIGGWVVLVVLAPCKSE